MRDRIILVGMLVLATGCSRGQTSVDPADVAERCGPDLLLVSVDTLRADHVSLYGYERPTTPNIDRWFGGAVRYERAYSTESMTPPSVVGFLSGLAPEQHRVRLFYQLLPADVRIVPDLLPDCYQSAAFVSNMVLTDEAIGLADRFDHYDDYVTEPGPRRIFERKAGPTTDAALAWLHRERDPERALFLWVHYFDPHGPYRPPPEWTRRFRSEDHREIVLAKIPPFQIQEGITNALDYVDLYDEEIRYTDSEIGRLLAGYDALRPLDDALVIFTADHGEAMMKRETWFEHGFQVWEGLVRVPLLIRGPGATGGVRTELVSTAEVAPTLLAAGRTAIPEALAPVDLRTGAGTSSDRAIFVEATWPSPQWRAVLVGRHKWVASVGANGRILGRRLYDLAADPHEKSPQPWPAVANPAATALETRIEEDFRLAARAPQVRAGAPLARPKVDPRAGAEERERLRALGYAN